MQHTKRISLTAMEADALLCRVDSEEPLSKPDRRLCKEALQTVFWMQQELEEAKLSIGRLRKLFDIHSEKQP